MRLAYSGLLRVGDFSDFGVKIPTMRLSKEGAARLKERQILRSGDVALTISGTVGKVAVISDALTKAGVAVSKSVAVIRCQQEMQAAFLTSLLRSPDYQSWMRGHARGVTIQHLSVRTLGNLPIPVPPIALQDVVIRHSEHGGDALSLLLRFAVRAADNPIAAWLERPGVVSILSAEEPQKDAARMLSDAGKELQTLRPLRNQAAHGQGIGLPEVVVRWVLGIVDAGSVLVGIDGVPEGSARVAALELARSRLAAAQKALGGSDQEQISSGLSLPYGSGKTHTILLIYRLQTLMSALDRLIDAATAEMLDDVNLRIKAEPSEVVVGVPTEVRLGLENSSPSGLRSVRVLTDPDVGRGTAAYLAESSTMHVPLTIQASDTTQPFKIEVVWQAMRLDGKAVQGSEQIEILVQSTRDAVMARDLGSNPYIVGTEPVKPNRQEMFFGRSEIIETIQRQLAHLRNRNIILLEGNRRTGKSSILWQLTPPSVLPGWIPVFCDFQRAQGAKEAAGIPTNEFYRLLAKVIGEALDKAHCRVWFPGVSPPAPNRPFELEFMRVLDRISEDPRTFEVFEIFLKEALRAIEPRRILLMLDEFDKLYDGIRNGVTSPAVPEQLRYLLQNYSGISAIITGSRRLKKLREEYFSVLFGLGIQIPVSALSPEEARRLVTEPVAGRLSFLEQARELVVSLCACHPYLIQSLCNRIFNNAARDHASVVTVDDVEVSAHTMVEGNEHFRTLWDYAETSRRRLILALCEMHASEADPVDLPFLAVKLETLGVHVARESVLGDDLEYLLELELIEFDKAYRGGTYRVSIPLLGRWINSTIDFNNAVARAREEAEEISS